MIVAFCMCFDRSWNVFTFWVRRRFFGANSCDKRHTLDFRLPWVFWLQSLKLNFLDVVLSNVFLTTTSIWIFCIQSAKFFFVFLFRNRCQTREKRMCCWKDGNYHLLGVERDWLPYKLSKIWWSDLAKSAASHSSIQIWFFSPINI